MKTVMKNITRLVILFRIHKIHQLKKYLKIVCIHFCPNNWHQSTCSCIYFKKSYICSHLLGLAIRLKLVEAPAEAQNLPLGKIRGSGRPSKVPINSCYTGEFVASQFAKIKPSQILTDEVQKMRIRLKFHKKHVFKLKIDFLSLDLVTT
jgi:hypothetical protein